MMGRLYHGAAYCQRAAFRDKISCFTPHPLPLSFKERGAERPELVDYDTDGLWGEV